MPSAQDILDSIDATRDRLGDQNGTSGGVNGRLEDVKGKLDTTNNDLNDIKGKLDTVNNKLDTLNAAVRAVDSDIKVVQQLLLWGFEQLITLGQYTNQALFHNDQQNDTMICQLQQISVNTCGIWNESHLQTGLQTSIRHSTMKLADLFAATHAEAELAREERERLQKEIEKCCPPPQPQPVCVEPPCPVPPPFTQQPPQTDPPPVIGPELDSILVRPSSFGVFGPEATINSGDSWDFQINLTGPVVDPTFLVSLQSSDPKDVPVLAATEIKQGNSSGNFLGGKAINPQTGKIDVTISATGKKVTKTAILHVDPVTK
jgi:predicted  nucleic acid-binding Zn-ribbon protein